jgi:hypothetical protein
MEDNIALIVIFLGTIFVVCLSIVGGGHLLDQKVLKCIEMGRTPMACKCALNGGETCLKFGQ